ncbi:MAG: hypothetical protein ACOY0T_04500 [Myxococcota bacterium]
MTRSDHEAGALRLSRREVCAAAIAVLPFGFACQRTSRASAQQCKEHVNLLLAASQKDVAEIRNGLPSAAKFLEDYVSAGKFDDATASKDALDRARNKVQDLRVAKTTFLALVDPQGVVLRSDESPDLLSGKNLFEAFPDLRETLSGKYVETRGSIEAASRIRGGPDGQWVAATPIKKGDAVAALYVGGWSWSAYAYRLQNHLQGKIRSALPERGKEPLTYVYMVVGDAVYGAPISPAVNARAIADQHFSKTAGNEAVVRELEITERDFGLGFLKLPDLGKDVGVAVLRSET